MKPYQAWRLVFVVSGLFWVLVGFAVYLAFNM